MADFVQFLDSVIPVEPDIRRKPNFTENEKLFLLIRYDQYKSILRNRGGTSREKYDVWSGITWELNAGNPNVQRTVKDVRKKWKNLVAQARKEFADYRENQNHGQFTPPSPFALKVLELMEEIVIRPNNNDPSAAAAPPAPTCLNNATAENSANTMNNTGPQPQLQQQNCEEPPDDDKRRVQQSVAAILPAAVESQNMDTATTTIRVTAGPPIVEGVHFPLPVFDGGACGGDRSMSTTLSSSSSSCSLDSVCGATPPPSYNNNTSITFENNGGGRIFSSSAAPSSSSLHANNRPPKRQLRDDDPGGGERARTSIRTVKELKQLKLQLETEKLILEKRKLALEIKLLSHQLRVNGLPQE